MRQNVEMIMTMDKNLAKKSVDKGRKGYSLVNNKRKQGQIKGIR